MDLAAIMNRLDNCPVLPRKRPGATCQEGAGVKRRNVDRQLDPLRNVKKSERRQAAKERDLKEMKAKLEEEMAEERKKLKKEVAEERKVLEKREAELNRKVEAIEEENKGTWEGKVEVMKEKLRRKKDKVKKLRKEGNAAIEELETRRSVVEEQDEEDARVGVVDVDPSGPESERPRPRPSH